MFSSLGILLSFPATFCERRIRNCNRTLGLSKSSSLKSPSYKSSIGSNSVSQRYTLMPCTLWNNLQGIVTLPITSCLSLSTIEMSELQTTPLSCAGIFERETDDYGMEFWISWRLSEEGFRYGPSKSKSTRDIANINLNIKFILKIHNHHSLLLIQHNHVLPVTSSEPHHVLIDQLIVSSSIHSLAIEECTISCI